MYIKRLLGYISGYICISVEGYYIERFINICMNKKIFLWNMNRERDTILKCRIYIHDFSKIRNIAKQTQCRIKIEGKKGLPFVLNKYKKRKFFAISFFIVIALIVFSTNFVWEIEVTGSENIDKNEILQIANGEGLNIGVLKNNVDEKKIIDKIRLERQDISWAAIEINGTKANIKIVEAEEKPEIINEEDYCNIVATKEGIIEKVNAVNGTPLVKEGDLVTKGTILVAGWLEGKYTGMRYVHANAEIQAKTWYTSSEKVYLNMEEEERTGNCETEYSVKINNFKINFKKGVPKFEFYDTITESNKIKIFSDIYLPIEIEKRSNYEIRKIQNNYTIEEAKNIAIQKARDKVYEQIENKENIINEIIKTTEDADFVEVEVTEEVLEDIGTKEKLVF